MEIAVDACRRLRVSRTPLTLPTPREFRSSTGARLSAVKQAACFACAGWASAKQALDLNFYVQIASAFMAALAAAHVFYEDVPTSFILAFVGKKNPTDIATTSAP